MEWKGKENFMADGSQLNSDNSFHYLGTLSIPTIGYLSLLSMLSFGAHLQSRNSHVGWAMIYWSE